MLQKRIVRTLSIACLSLVLVAAAAATGVISAGTSDGVNTAEAHTHPGTCTHSDYWNTIGGIQWLTRYYTWDNDFNHEHFYNHYFYDTDQHTLVFSGHNGRSLNCPVASWE